MRFHGAHVWQTQSEAPVGATQSSDGAKPMGDTNSNSLELMPRTKQLTLSLAVIDKRALNRSATFSSRRFWRLFLVHPEHIEVGTAPLKALSSGLRSFQHKEQGPRFNYSEVNTKCAENTLPPPRNSGESLRSVMPLHGI